MLLGRLGTQRCRGGPPSAMSLTGWFNSASLGGVECEPQGQWYLGWRAAGVARGTYMCADGRAGDDKSVQTAGVRQTRVRGTTMQAMHAGPPRRACRGSESVFRKDTIASISPRKKAILDQFAVCPVASSDLEHRSNFFRNAPSIGRQSSRSSKRHISLVRTSCEEKQAGTRETADRE
ncbi:uncharacterized protein C8Q71DRAFT_290260 [Rhodofomes roseus]|uniref:Uncharacterized protein n=1 Tax=Rhodofomes roseus TaxID=34475 RepID=A0ABQ8K3Y1_9APHY|nr:uncharacterized protein C8Q71DRAFT_290260 [Rhodofomes roseus]KAH9831540.1 hypothetical protein C8Q71DRAFT_290260 [Rhodofomes roseus]